MVVEANGGILAKWYLGHLKWYLERSAHFEEQRTTSGGAECNFRAECDEFGAECGLFRAECDLFGAKCNF